MLLGSDRLPGRVDFRTDAFMLLSYNPESGATSIISIPRDTYVYLPALKRWHRINTAMEFGGFSLLADTLAYNFGVRPQHFVMVDFQGFATLVDRLGGLNIYVPHQLCDRRTHYSDHYCIGPGSVHMDGSLALWYARSRITTNDFDRASRQQALVLAMVRKLLSLNGLARAPQLYTAYRNIITTDISLSELTKMLLQARHFDANGIRTYLLQPPALRPWTTPQGSYVLIQNYPQVRTLLEEALQR